MEQVFEILKERPTLSIVLGFTLAVLLILILRDQIKQWFIKHYDLSTREEIIQALDETENGLLKSQVSKKDFKDAFIINLDYNKTNRSGRPL